MLPCTRPVYGQTRRRTGERQPGRGAHRTLAAPDAGRRRRLPARPGRQRAQFKTISQAWLREPVKAWSRFRLSTGLAFTTISAGALALGRFPRLFGRLPPGCV